MMGRVSAFPAGGGRESQIPESVYSMKRQNMHSLRKNRSELQWLSVPAAAIGYCRWQAFRDRGMGTYV